MSGAGLANPSIRVLVADDHPVMRRGIVAAIHDERDMLVVAEAGNGREAVDCFARHRPDVVMMDLQMPEMNGVEATAAILAQWSEARIVVLTTFRGDALALRALKAGASGYLLKSAIRMELPAAIRATHAGRRYITPEVAAELAAHVTDDALSPREIDVLKLVAAGGSNRRVAHHLSVTEDTVKAHMKSIMNKLSAKDRTHAVTIAIQRGIISV
jgi:DNA-binding NarL/FixJ family response regulator